MKKLERWLELTHERAIENEFDRVVPVVADEGYGKSTLMLELNVLWLRTLGWEIDTEEMLEQIIWTRDEYKRALSSYPRKSAILVPDAARVLYKRDSMNTEQKEVEKDMLQSRIQENLVLLGFQSWSIIPTMLQERRAKNILRIPTRGKVEGYNRSSIDEKDETGEWPEPDLIDSFPSLEGTDLWKDYKELDTKMKLQLMGTEDDEDVSLKQIASEVIEEGVDNWTSEHPQNGRKYVDKDLIEIDYGLSHRKAGKVKKLVEREIDLDALNA